MYAEQASGKNADAKLYFFKGYPPATTPKRIGGAERDRTADPLLAKQVLSQLSYSPIQLDHPSLINQARQQFASTNSLNPNPHSHMQMVGLGRLELPTPRLSSVCSNQLSYRPNLDERVYGFVFMKKEKRGRRSSPYHPITEVIPWRITLRS